MADHTLFSQIRCGLPFRADHLLDVFPLPSVLLAWEIIAFREISRNTSRQTENDHSSASPSRLRLQAACVFRCWGQILEHNITAANDRGTDAE